MTKIAGRAKLLAKLKALPGEARSRIKQAIAEGADELVAMQKRLAPVEDGDLRDSIVQSWGTSAPKYAALKAGASTEGDPDLSVTISAGNTKVRYAHLVEFGAKAHTITSKTGKRLGPRGQYGLVVNHPGATAKPFFYPSYRALKKRIKGRISRATRLAAKKVAGQ